nr:gliding motility-associated C-terminal domain-containing protein [Chitinophagales bacterium]
ITTLLPSSAITLNATSCNPNDTGTIVRTLTAANGCDSIVTTITSLINCFTVDTIRDTNQIGTSIVVCVPLEPNFEVTTGSIGNCGYTNQSGNIYTVDNNGCITIVRSNLVGYNLDTICVVVCNSVGLCDTTNVILSNIPRTDTIRDTNLINTTEEICVAIENGMINNTTTIINCGHSNNSGNTYTVTNNNGCITIVRSNSVGLNLDTLCVVVCSANGICDTTTLIVSNTRFCEDLIRDTIINCTTPVGGGLCLPINLNTIQQYNIFVDGTKTATSFSSISGCGSSTNIAGYNFQDVNYVDNVPHLLEQFSLDSSQTFTPNINFTTLSDLVDYLNTIDPAGNWFVDGFYIKPANPSARYNTGSGFTFFSLQPQAATYNVKYFDKTIYNGSVIKISNGCHQVLLVDTITGCRDSAQVCVIGECGLIKDTIIDTITIKDTIVICPEKPTGNNTIVKACDGSSNGISNFGTWIIDNKGCLQFIAGEIKGTDTLCVKACDTITKKCIETTIIITVVGIPPIAINDTAVTDPNTPVVITVLNNDIKTDEDPLALCGLSTSEVIVTNPTNGTVIINANGTITYTPNNDYKGVDSFQYQICDPEGRDTAWVYITIRACIVPDGITPNNDGFNDFFEIPCLFELNEDGNVLLCVYNRWGTEVYRNTQYDNRFNGIYQGQELPDGTYYYVLEYTDKNGNKIKQASFLVIHRSF